MRAVLKYKDHPSFLTIQNKCQNQIKFNSKEIDLASIEKEVPNLKINKVSQSLDIRTKTIKKCWCFWRIFIKKLNTSIKSSIFPSCLKLADVTPLLEKEKNIKKITTEP